MKQVQVCIQLFLYFIMYYTIFNLLITRFMEVVWAIPLINRTNPYYEKHLEHINSI